jgi:hypothetical protein
MLFASLRGPSKIKGSSHESDDKIVNSDECRPKTIVIFASIVVAVNKRNVNLGELYVTNTFQSLASYYYC